VHNTWFFYLARICNHCTYPACLAACPRQAIYKRPEDGIVLIDPLVPPEESDRFGNTLDREVAGQPVHVLVTIFWHTRSSAALVERYGARVWAPTTSRAAVARRAGVVTDAFRPGDALPGGVQAFRTARSTEVVYWIPRQATLVPGDVLLGDGNGGVRMCPESWLPGTTKHGDLAASLAPLLELPIKRILVSHGEPVLENGRAALAVALDA
jgi:glyoxylase-like metal-dependent hydrolase (beta-lactamase superfamily II)